MNVIMEIAGSLSQCDESLAASNSIDIAGPSKAMLETNQVDRHSKNPGERMQC
jgi:hypothetical protein